SWSVSMRDDFTDVVSQDTFRFTYTPLVGVDDKGSSPYSWRLEQNYPNPFNPSTRIRFTLAEPARVTLVVYDELGRAVRTLINNQLLGSGNQELLFDAANLASGAYYYRLTTPHFTRVGRMLLNR